MAAHVLVSHLLPSLDNRREIQNWKNNYTTECQTQIYCLNVRLFSVIRCRLNCIFLFRLAVLAFLPCFAGQKASPVFERCLIQAIMCDIITNKNYSTKKDQISLQNFPRQAVVITYVICCEGLFSNKQKR